METGESSHSGNTGTPLYVLLGYQVSYPRKPFFWLGGGIQKPHTRCICALFLPFGECTAGVHHAGRVQVRRPRVTLNKAQGLTIWYGLGLQQYSHGVVGLPLLLYNLWGCVQKAESHANEKKQLPFSTTEGCVDCPAIDKLNF